MPYGLAALRRGAYSVNVELRAAGVVPASRASRVAWMTLVVLAGQLACQPDGPRGSRDGLAPDAATRSALPSKAARSADAFALDAMMARLAPLHARPHAARPGEWLAEHDEPGQSFVQYLADAPMRVDVARDGRRAIHLQPLGPLRPAERRIAELTAELLERFFGLPTVLAPELDVEVPAAARRLVPGARAPQLLTSHLLEQVLLPRLPSDAAAFVSLTAADLWPGDGYDFVFGQASLRDRVGVWSLHRFGDPAESPAAFRRALLRALKVAVHETGHLFSMRHCTAFACVMAGTNHLAETDDSPLWLCPECLAKLVWATGISPREHYQRLADFLRRAGLRRASPFLPRVRRRARVTVSSRPVAALAVLALCAGAAACVQALHGGPPIDQPPVNEVPLLDERCGTSSAAALRWCVDPARIRADVERIASPRPPGSEQHDRVRDLCRERLASLGFVMEDLDYGTGRDVIGVKPGVTSRHLQVVIGAHYDYLERCPGADDNASGVAGALETARILAKANFNRTLVVACWDEFERGARGSSAYAKRAAERDDAVTATFALESIGYASREPNSQRVPDDFEHYFPEQALALLENDYRADFLLVVSDDASSDAAMSVARHGERVGLPVELLQLTARHKYEKQGIHRRDQASFWDYHLPGVLLTDSGQFRNPRIGCAHGLDAANTLDYEFAGNVVQAAIGAMADVLVLR